MQSGPKNGQKVKEISKQMIFFFAAFLRKTPTSLAQPSRTN